MALATILGFPRIGASREMKVALESFWQNKISEFDLKKTASEIKKSNWEMQRDCGISEIPSNDFSLYDHVLDMSVLLGVVPARYNKPWGNVDLATYFAMARGVQKGGIDLPASEMTKWFDTNYHYLVPEFNKNISFRIASAKPFDEFKEALALGYKTRPVLVGPMTYLLLSKCADKGNCVNALDRFLPVYADVLKQLERAGAEWVQLDEPMLVADLGDDVRRNYEKAYAYLRQNTNLKIFMTSYFGDLGKNVDLATSLPIDALHIDLVRGSGQLDEVLAKIPSNVVLSMGIVDGRNIWKTNLVKSLKVLETAASKIGKERIWVSSSCSLMHVPYDLDSEMELDPTIKGWLAFGKQKLAEIAALTKGLNQGHAAIADLLVNSDQVEIARRAVDEAVRKRMEAQPLSSAGRKSPYSARRKSQQDVIKLPLYPTTTIGSYPQTAEVRRCRANFKQKKIDYAAYEAFMKQQISNVIKFQEKTGLDVLVHGEFERNDMVEYFGEQLKGFAFTKNGWVQSAGPLCVKPPIIYGDISRPKPMTVEWSKYAQSCTSKPMKGMLTGPITILQWSFVRDDLPHSSVAHQIALALQDEVLDLENAGIKVIQIDEPALREGLPLRREGWSDYLNWAVASFKLSYTGIKDETQLHTHMCYSEFNDIIDSITALDADVISMEMSRSNMDMLEVFAKYKYPNEIGPGVYDIHSPRVPGDGEMAALIEKACKSFDKGQIWINPDCGLKTRAWVEVQPALENMVKAARQMRAKG